MEPVKTVQMKIYHSDTYRRDFSWLHFDDEPVVQERWQVKDQPSCISFSVAYQQFQAATRGTSPDVTTVLHAWAYGRFIEIQNNLRRKILPRTNQSSNFLGDSFSNRDNVRAQVQFRRESQPQHLKT